MYLGFGSPGFLPNSRIELRKKPVSWGQVGGIRRKNAHGAATMMGGGGGKTSTVVLVWDQEQTAVKRKRTPHVSLSTSMTVLRPHVLPSLLDAERPTLLLDL